MDDAQGDINHFQALCAALSATVGTGNIAGVALAIAIGGPEPSSGCGSPDFSEWPVSGPNVLLRSITG